MLALASGRAAAQGVDGDLDGVADAEDNCARAYNPDQEDHDADGVGTTCDATRGVPDDESAIVLYLRDQSGRPVREACFHVTLYAESQDEPPEPMDVCGDEFQPGFAVVRLDPGLDVRAEIAQAEVPSACTGGLAGTHVHEADAGKWEVVTVRYRCGAGADDPDRDLVPAGADNCAAAFNPDQEDTDDDGFGNGCDPEPGIVEDESHVVLYLRDQDGLALWDVCFRLTEVRTDETLEPADVCVDGSTPGYLLLSLEGEGALRSELTPTAALPGCRGGLRGTQSYPFAAGSWRVVDVRYACAMPVTFADRMTPADRREPHSVRVARGTRRIEFHVRWRRARDSFDVTGITFGDAARSPASRGQAPARVRITRRRTPTSVRVRVEKLRAGKVTPGAPSVPEQLAFTVVGTRVGAAATATTRVTQHRRVAR